MGPIIDPERIVRYRKSIPCEFGHKILMITGLQYRDGYVYKNKDFNLFDTEETEIPKDYEKEEISMEWVKEYICDPSRKRLYKNNDQYKLIQEKHKDSVHYFTLDNYSKPFIVYILDKIVEIFKEPEEGFYTRRDDWEDDDEDKIWMYITLVAEYNIKDLFLGKSKLNAMTKFSGGYGPEFDGNSILLHIDDGDDEEEYKYVYVGNSVKEFTTNAKIVEYVSPVGNNCVPYPYALDTEGNYYLMIEDKVINGIHFKKESKDEESEDEESEDGDPDESDPYSIYYGHDKVDQEFTVEHLEMDIIHKRIGWA